MQGKKRAGPVVVAESAAQAARRRGPVTELEPEEEKVMRMRLGAAPPRTAPLERSFDEASDAEIEVRAAEIEAWMRWKAARAAPAPTPAPVPSRAKEKIIRALRRKT